MTPSEIRRIQRAETLEELHEWADELLAQARRRRARYAPTRKAKEEKRQQHRDETYLLRIYAFERWGGRCLACMCMLPQDWHLHHIVGAGLRRTRQTKGNTVPLCPACHRLAHAGNMDTLKALWSWAQTNGDAGAKAALERRLDKIDEARAAGRTE